MRRGRERNLREGGGYCSRSETVTSVVTGWRWKKAGNWGLLVSEWEREGCTGLGFFLPGLRAGILKLGRTVSPQAFSIFIFVSSFLFVFCFVS
jgi:hypothetical protein